MKKVTMGAGRGTGAGAQRKRQWARLVGLVLVGSGIAAAAEPVLPERPPTPVSGPRPMGFGCYAYAHELGGLAYWRAHVRLMKAHGMNTFAIFTRGPRDIATQIDIAVEEGMLEQRVPIFLLEHAGPAIFKELVPDWDEVVRADVAPPPGWAAGQAVGVAAVISRARQLARYRDRWPELVLYSVDEPGRGEPLRPEGIKQIGEFTARYNASGFRCGTACIFPNVKNLVGSLDVIAVASIYGGDLRGCKRAIENAGKEFWVYNTGLLAANPKLLRWSVGYWSWQVQPRSYLAWNWKSFVMGELAEPRPTEKLRAYAAGVADYRSLIEAERYLAAGERKSVVDQQLARRLQDLRNGFAWENLPPREFAQTRARKQPWHATVPELDLDRLRALATQARLSRRE
ncbi:MAG: hypothetical protein VX346_17910 [Planctomycetota bacterium]|nr:hypothetical protein [Planctomycetota bacterium]